MAKISFNAWQNLKNFIGCNFKVIKDLANIKNYNLNEKASNRLEIRKLLKINRFKIYVVKKYLAYSIN